MITIFGSINVDLVCQVAKSPMPGETVMGSDYRLIPGGKGANQALAARRAGAEVKLVGAIGDARWVAPNVELTADGKPVPTSEFFEGGSRGQDMRWSARVPGLNLEFERHWLAPERDAAVTRVRENGKVLAAYRAELEGAVHAGQRWLFVFTSARERSVLELQGNVFLPVLGPEPETASLTEPAVEAKPTPGPDFAAMGGNVRVTRAPSAGKSIQVTVKGVSREAERLTFQLDGGRVLQLSTPPELPSPVAAGDALVLEILAHGGGPNRRHHVVARSPEGELVFEVGSSSSKAKDFSVTRGAERMAQPEGDRVRHDYRVRFEHAGSSVEVEPGSFSRLDAKYVVWGSATRQELGKGKKRPPDFVESWLDFAVFRLP